MHVCPTHSGSCATWPSSKYYHGYTDQANNFKSEKGTMTPEAPTVSQSVLTDRQRAALLGRCLWGPGNIWDENKVGGDERREAKWSGSLVIKTFHDIRICEVPWADHRDHSVKSIFLLLIVVQRGRTTARGVVVVYSDCLGNKRTQFSTRLWSKVTFHSLTLQKKIFLNQYFFLVLQ